MPPAAVDLDELPAFVPLTTVADLFEVHVATLYEQIKRGDFPLEIVTGGVKFRNAKKVRKADLVEFMAAQR